MSCTVRYRCAAPPDDPADRDLLTAESPWNPAFHSDSLRWAACAAARQFHDEHDGWDATWPRMFVLYREDGSEIGRTLVSRESEPHFTANDDDGIYPNNSFPEGTEP